MATFQPTADSVCDGAKAGAAVDEQFFRDLFANMRSGVIVICRDGTLVSMNDAAYASLSLTPHSNDEGRPASAVLVKAPELVRVLDHAFDTEVLANRAEVRLESTGRSIGYTLSLVRNELGETTGAALFFKDLTRVEFIEERERLRDRLAALGEMAAAIAHEVKNPLAGIEVMAGLLKRRLPGDAANVTLLNDIITEAKMANAIVLEVLEFVRPVRLHADTVRIATLLGDALLMAGSHVPRGDVVVSVDVADDVPDIHGDDHQLRQVFTNLLTNALEALNGKGRLELRVSVATQPVWPGSDVTHAQVVLVEIEDDGPGVPESIRDRIFNPFFTTKPKGSGLGLSIVRKIVDAHEGRLDWQEGAGGAGSCFRIALPVRPALEPVVATASDAGAPGGPRPR